MAAEYDKIGSPYNQVKDLPIVKYVETPSVKAALAPYLSSGGPKVLDLACGSGFYSRLMLSWGASQVLGVDISAAMIDVARADASRPEGPDLAYLVSDASQLGDLSARGAPFDVVAGVWLLNYADDLAGLTRMWEVVARNLAPGGVFVGVTTPPVDDMEAHVAETRRFFAAAAHPKEFGLTIEYDADPVPSGDGYRAKLTPHVAREFSFHAYHLRRAVVEQAARDAGMKGRLEWKIMDVSDEGRAALGDDFWKRWEAWNNRFAILVVEKD